MKTQLAFACVAIGLIGAGTASADKFEFDGVYATPNLVRVQTHAGQMDTDGVLSQGEIPNPRIDYEREKEAAARRGDPRFNNPFNAAVAEEDREYNDRYDRYSDQEDRRSRIRYDRARREDRSDETPDERRGWWGW